MIRAAFTPSLITGDPFVDGQHRHLISKINALLDAKDADTALKTLDFLIAYTGYHFAMEEQIMEENQYPQLAAHKEVHAQLVEDVKKLRDLLQAEGPTENFMNQINNKVTDWLYNHIKGDDQAFAEYKNIRQGAQCGMDNML